MFGKIQHIPMDTLWSKCSLAKHCACHKKAEASILIVNFYCYIRTYNMKVHYDITISRQIKIKPRSTTNMLQ